MYLMKAGLNSTNIILLAYDSASFTAIDGRDTHWHSPARPMTCSLFLIPTAPCDFLQYTYSISLLALTTFT